MTVYTHLRQERVYFGEDYAAALADEVERLSRGRAYFLASHSMAEKTDLVVRAEAAQGDRFAGCATGMPPHTPREAVLEMTRGARAARADLIVTFGGGSLTDAGKLVRLCLDQDIDNIDGFDRFRTIVHTDGRREFPQLPEIDIPQITIPTTLSGGEFNLSAGCTDVRAKSKQLYRHPSLTPVAVILDPSTTVYTPQWLWMSTGMRAVDHCIETICSHLGNRQSDGAAFNGLRLLCAGLPAVKANPKDLQARLNCQIGAWQAMEHNQSGVSMGASHGIGHVLGGTCSVPHGQTSCVMLPAVLKWNADHNAERQALVSETMGRPGEPASRVVEEFVAALGQPTRLSQVDVGPDQFSTIALHAMHDHYIHTNPRLIDSPAQIEEILGLAA